MHFKISTFTFPMYNLWILIALIVAGLFVYKNLRDNRIPRKIVILTLFLSLVSIVVGGKLFAFFTNERAVDFKTSTISSYGSVIGLILFLILFTKIYKWNSNTIFTTYLLTAPLMYSVSKIGCFFVGCCLGIPYDGIFRVEYNNVRTNSRAFPIQLLETIVFAVIFIVCNKLYKNGSKKYINEIIILISAFFKFLLDFLRESHASGLTITVNQIVSILFCIVVVISIYIKRRKKLL